MDRNQHGNPGNINDALYSWGAWRARQMHPARRRYSSVVYSPPKWVTVRKTCGQCYGSDMSPPCGRCKGRGHYHERAPLIDPATIRGRSVMTVSDGGEPPDLYRDINAAVDSFDHRRRVVVMVRYVYAPRARKPYHVHLANRIFLDDGHNPITVHYYGELLTDCKRRIAEILHLAPRAVA